MWSAFFLYFLIFSCFSEARKAVKRFPNREYSYTELTLNCVKDLNFRRKCSIFACFFYA